MVILIITVTQLIIGMIVKASPGQGAKVKKMGGGQEERKDDKKTEEQRKEREEEEGKREREKTTMEKTDSKSNRLSLLFNVGKSYFEYLYLSYILA